MCGKETLTTVVSSTSIKVLSITATAIIHGLMCGGVRDASSGIRNLFSETSARVASLTIKPQTVRSRRYHSYPSEFLLPPFRCPSRQYGWERKAIPVAPRGARLFPHEERVSLQPPQRFHVLRLRAAPALQDQDLVVAIEREGVPEAPRVVATDTVQLLAERGLQRPQTPRQYFESRNSAAPTVNDLTCTTLQTSSVCVAEMVIVPVRICGLLGAKRGRN